ncbi:MAG: sodium-dependent transporter [Alistipes sp.]|nr:sodium-dependent transporter [Alistipes sp.]
MENKKRRATFGGKISAVLVAAGSAVGLGNIWRFPYVAGENGGGAFLLIYILCILLLGMPLMIAEFSIGAKSRSNAVGAFRALGHPRWSTVGYIGIAASVLILGFYLVVAGWTAEYMIHSLTDDLVRQSDAALHQSSFQAFITHPWKPVFYTALFAIATHTIIVLGVKEGIERASKVMMPLLFLILIILAIRSLMMPNGMEGLRFFLAPDFSKVTPATVLTALGQAFFSLSVGLGTMITYASYFTPDTNIRQTAFEVGILDTLVAILAGLVIFPAVFSVGIEPNAGPSLVFITLPSVFSSLPLSQLWSSIFFLLLVIAALTSTISLHEAATAYLTEEWNLPRKHAARLTTLFTILLGATASLSLGVLNHWRICGLSIFDFLDYLTANIMLPLGGVLICLFVGWRLDRKSFEQQLYGDCKPSLSHGLMRGFIRYLCPFIILCIFLHNLNII